MKQRLIAKQKVEDDPRCCRTQHDRSQQRRVQITHHFFQRKEHRCDWRIEGSSQSCSCANGQEALYLFFGKAKPPRKYRCDACA
jgi:hypothetical protein